MANYATNLFYAETKNGNDLKKVEDYLEENFCDCYVNRLEDAIDCEFSSKWIYPEEMIDNMIYASEQILNSIKSRDFMLGTYTKYQMFLAGSK